MENQKVKNLLGISVLNRLFDLLQKDRNPAQLKTIIPTRFTPQLGPNAPVSPDASSAVVQTSVQPFIGRKVPPA